MVKDPPGQHWDVIITPDNWRFRFQLSELWDYRDLIALLVRRNFVVNYKQTILGPMWFLLQPLATTGIFLVIFGMIAKISTDNTSPVLFYMSGIILWSNFASNVTGTSDVFVANMALFGKIYFPRISIPIATILTSFIALSMQSVVFAGLYAYLVFIGAMQAPSPLILFVPLLFVANAVLALGFGMLFSSLTTRYRDLTFALGFCMQLWMYATPVIYPLSVVPEKWRLLFALNPVSTLLELFRLVTLGVGTVSIGQLALSFAVAVGVLGLGLWNFGRIEGSAIDTV